MTTNTPKPIDTQYNGYKFRSRLEAHWAICCPTAVFKGRCAQKRLGEIEEILDMLVMLGQVGDVGNGRYTSG
jgi:hypothetical protein